MKYYNVHSHVFTMTNAPRKFLHLYLPGFLAEAIDKITNTTAGAASFELLLGKLAGNGGKRYASFLSIGKSKNQLEVFETLRKQYDNDNNVVLVGLTMNMEYCGAGASVSGFEGQLEEVLNVKRQYPDELLLFLGIDPRWKTDGKSLKETVARYFETPLKINESRSVYPFAGLKIYPSMGFYAFDQRLMETFEWAAEKAVPILSHCNYLGGIYNNDADYLKSQLSQYDPYSGKIYEAAYVRKRKFMKWIMGTQKSNNNLDSCSYFMEPVSFRSLLDHFEAPNRKPLKICLAHFGGGNQVSDRNNPDIPFGNGKKNWFVQIQEMLAKYKGLYTDISYALHDEKLIDVFVSELNNPAYGNRIMFGTDYFLTEREQPEKITYNKFRLKAQSQVLSHFNDVNAWDQIAGNNISNFLKSDFYTG